VFDQEYTILPSIEIELLQPNGLTIEPAKALEEVFLIFEPTETIYFNQTDGNNIIAFHVMPGDYAVFGEITNQTNSPYLIVYDEFGNIMEHGSFIHVETETVLYFNFMASGGWSQNDRPFNLKEVTTLHQGEANIGNINGTVTLDFTEDDLEKVLVFPDTTFNGIIIFESDDVALNNLLLFQGDTRCEDFNGDVACAIKTYENADLTINITSNDADSVTLDYRLVEYDLLSTEQTNPTPIDTILNGASFEPNTDYYLSFESTGNNYLFRLILLHPGYSISSSIVLYNDAGTEVVSNWTTNTYLEPGIYVIKVSVQGFHSAILPQIEMIETS
jgi:hypothetical protein